MNAKKRKSKKRSVANSKPQPEQFVLYLDRNLGKHVIAATLRKIAVSVEIHDNHLATDAPDEEWIALVGQNKWIAITKDKNIRYRHAEIEAIKAHNARVLVLRAKNATGPEIANILVNAVNHIKRFASKTDPPFIAGLDRSGTIKLYNL